MNDKFSSGCKPTVLNRSRRRLLLYVLAPITMWAIVFIVWNVAAGKREQRSVKELPAFHGCTVNWQGRITGVRLDKADADQVEQLAAFHLTSLQLLQLSECDLRDDDLMLLEQFPGVVDLSLWGTPISDDGLVHLERLHGLLHLDLTATEITSDGVNRLRRGLPHTNIDAFAPRASTANAE